MLIPVLMAIVTLGVTDDTYQVLETKQGKRYARYAQRGVRMAQRELAKLFFYSSEKESYEHAFYWFSEAADQDDVSSFYFLGVMHRDGLSVADNEELAVFWFEKAAVRSDPRALRALSVIMKERGAYEQEWQLLDRLSEVTGQWLYVAKRQAEMVMLGQGVAQSDQLAAQRYLEVAQQIEAKGWSARYAEPFYEKAARLGSRVAETWLQDID